MIDTFQAVSALHRWYVNYDEGRLDALEAMLTEDAVTRSRTDTGKHPQEAFIHSDERGRAAVLAWTREHRMSSPYPLRHHLTNLFVSAERADEVDLEGYLLVTTIAEGRPWPMSSGLFYATVRVVGGEYRIARKEVVLDTIRSVPLSEFKREVPR